MHKDELKNLLEELTFLKDEGVANGENYFTNTGLHIKRKDETIKAMDYFNRSLKIEPNYVRGLRARAETESSLFRYHQAKADLERVLKIIPDDMHALSTKALVTYLGRDFETALIQNLKMTKLRQKPENFVHGVMHCQDAIENGVGPRAGHPLRDHYNIIRRMAWHKSIQKQNPLRLRRDEQRIKKIGRSHIHSMRLPSHPKKHLKSGEYATSGMPSSNQGLPGAGLSANFRGADKDDEEDLEDSLNNTKTSLKTCIPKNDFPFHPIQRYTKNIKNYMAERYLDGMYRDKLFLKDMKKTPGLCCPNKAGNKNIKSLIKSAHKYICQNEETLRSRRPFYFYKFQEKKLNGTELQQRQMEQLQKIIITCEHEADILLKKCCKAAIDSNVQFMSVYAEKLRQFCENTQKKFLPRRENILMNLYSTVCEGYLNSKKFQPDMCEADKITRAKVYMLLPFTEKPSRDSLYKRNTNQRQDFNKLCAIYEERIKRAKYEEEALWLYHELARMNLKLKEYQLSKVYAKKCCALAEAINNPKWLINAMYLIARNFVVQKNRNDAKSELRSIETVVKYLNIPRLTEFLNKCIEVVSVEQMEERGEELLIRERQKQILKLLRTDELKSKADDVFRKIQNLPPERRMTVLPGTSYPEKMKISQVPSFTPSEHQSEISAKSKSVKMKRSTIGSTKKGIEFLNLIKYHVEY